MTVRGLHSTRAAQLAAVRTRERTLPRYDRIRMRITLTVIPPALIAVVVTLLVMRNTTAPQTPRFTPSPTPITAARDLATPTPTPTATPTPSPSPTPQPTPSPTATPEPNSPEAVRYQAAITARDDGALDDAVEHFQQVIAQAGPLAPFARLRLAQALLAGDQHVAAAAAFEAALTDPHLPPILHPLALTEGAAALAAADRPHQAIAWLTNALNHPSTSSGELTAATWQRALIRLDLEDPLWTDDALAVLSTAPGSPQATAALIALEEADQLVPPLTAAYSQYRARENTDATDRYEAIRDQSIAVDDNSTAAIAAFYLGALAERIAGRTAAIDAYSHSLELDPLGAFADDAAYWRGRVAEERADFELAATSYGLLLSSYRSSSFVTDATLRAALTTYQSGNELAGLERLAAIAESAAPTNTAAARWYDLLAGPDAREAIGLLAPADLDARSLGAVLATRSPQPQDAPPSELAVEPLPAVPAASEDLEVIAAWLLDRFGADLQATQATTTSTVVWDTTIPALVEADEHALARVLALGALNLVSGNDPAEIAIALRARDLELHDIALIATLRVVGGWSTAERLTTPLALERLGYPSPWTSELEAATTEFGVPPFLLLALVRQESAFNPEAVSPAAAVGLTQVIPRTGALIAASLDEPWEGSGSLTDPATSLRYGAAYLAAQLESFHGNLYATLAAYNGGPSNAHRWLDEQQLPDDDGFVQIIDFEETRRYVATVIEQFAWYRYVYGLAETPALP